MMGLSPYNQSLSPDGQCPKRNWNRILIRNRNYTLAIYHLLCHFNISKKVQCWRLHINARATNVSCGSSAVANTYSASRWILSLNWHLNQSIDWSGVHDSRVNIWKFHDKFKFRWSPSRYWDSAIWIYIYHPNIELGWTRTVPMNMGPTWTTSRTVDFLGKCSSASSSAWKCSSWNYFKVVPHTSRQH